MDKLLLKQFICFLTILFFITGCCNNRVWKSNDFTDWYRKYWNNKNTRPFYRPLYYQGSSSKYHHFIMRTMDSFLLVKIDKNELKIQDEKPYRSGSSAKFPGYYIVDPMNGFKRIYKK